MSLQESCILVSLNIGLPPLTRLAKSASRDVEEKYQTASRQARVNKNLFARKDIQPLQTAAAAARALFSELTLPYDVGHRILPTEAYFSFTEKMSAASCIYDSLRQKFLDNYELSLQRSQSELGTLWRGEDYPSANDLDNRMYLSIESTLIPASTAFDNLVGISDDEIAALKQEAVKGQQDKVDEALRELVGRLKNSLNKAAIRLANTDTYFKDTIITNITATLEAVETLNLTQDQRLIDLAQEVRDTLEGITPKDLRKDEKLREETAEQAQKLVDRVGEFF